MTLTLILTRHAKSSWGDADLADHDRLLNKRGRASAKAIGRWMADHGLVPDEVLCSGALRTRQTWTHIAETMVGDPEAQFTDALYLADADAMRNVLAMAEGKTVMMVAHNPGSAYMARKLVAEAPDHAKFSHYPTGATAVIEFDVDDWAEVQWKSGRVVEFVVPRELI